LSHDCFVQSIGKKTVAVVAFFFSSSIEAEVAAEGAIAPAAAAVASEVTFVTIVDSIVY
jgi:hypothetical protein